jgi:hypothetical protein
VGDYPLPDEPLSLYPFKEPCNMLFLRGWQMQVVPLCLSVPIAYHLKGDGKGLAALIF